MPELVCAADDPRWLDERRRGVIATLPFCQLCGNVNPSDLGPVTSTCLNSRACRRRQAGLADPEENTSA